MKFFCKVCNKESESDSMEKIIDMKKTCSIKCFEDLRKIETTKTKKVKCKCCDTMIVSRLRNDGTRIQLYCSDKCAIKAHKERKKKIPIEKENEIKAKLLKKRNDKKKKVECKQCSNSFLSDKAKYCSKECRKLGIEKTKFYGNLKGVNQQIQSSKIVIYGFGKEAYEGGRVR